jgi:hypothetical protein
MNMHCHLDKTIALFILLNMATQKPKKRPHVLYVRLTDPNHEHVSHQTKNPQFRTAANYLNWLIEQDRAGRDEGLRALEEKISATIDQVRQDIAQAHMASEANGAFIHACVKMLLVNSPEADATTKQIAMTQAERRYQTLLTNTAKSMNESRS